MIKIDKDFNDFIKKRIEENKKSCSEKTINNVNKIINPIFISTVSTLDILSKIERSNLTEKLKQSIKLIIIGGLIITISKDFDMAINFCNKLKEFIIKKETEFNKR